MYGRNHTDEAKLRISNANKGKSFNKGIKKSIKHRQKISEYAKTRFKEKNSFYGRNHTDEVKLRISNSNKGNIPSNRIKIMIDGFTYSCCREASEKLNIKSSTIYHRIKSRNKKYENYIKAPISV